MSEDTNARPQGIYGPNPGETWMITTGAAGGTVDTEIYRDAVQALAAVEEAISRWDDALEAQMLAQQAEREVSRRHRDAKDSAMIDAWRVVEGSGEKRAAGYRDALIAAYVNEATEATDAELRAASAAAERAEAAALIERKTEQLARMRADLAMARAAAAWGVRIGS